MRCIRLGSVAALLLPLMTTSCASQSKAGPRAQAGTHQAEQWPSGLAVLYVRSHSRGKSVPETLQVVWQRGPKPDDARVVYETSDSAAGCGNPGVPFGFGVLPSPDGRWLHVWETIYHQSGGALNKTVWVVVELPTGRRVKIGEQPRETGLFPYWLDDHRLLLEKGDDSTIFDVRTGQLTEPLPPRGDLHGHFVPMRNIDPAAVIYDDRVRAWQLEYIRGHYPRELELLRSALVGLPGELGIASYLRPREWPEPDTPEDLLLRPLGIVSWLGPGRSEFTWPGVAVSPDGNMLARTGFVVSGRREVEDASGHRFLGGTLEARVDVFALPSGERVWGKSVSHGVGKEEDVVTYWSHPHMGFGKDPWFRDPRWSRDGRYLVFITRDEPSRRDSVSVVDTSTWQVVAEVADAADAFVIPGTD